MPIVQDALGVFCGFVARDSAASSNIADMPPGEVLLLIQVHFRLNAIALC